MMHPYSQMNPQMAYSQQQHYHPNWSYINPAQAKEQDKPSEDEGAVIDLTDDLSDESEDSDKGTFTKRNRIDNDVDDASARRKRSEAELLKSVFVSPRKSRQKGSSAKSPKLGNSKKKRGLLFLLQLALWRKRMVTMKNFLLMCLLFTCGRRFFFPWSAYFPANNGTKTHPLSL